ncbi:MAG: DDE domain-containing protein [Nitrosopumilus sp. H8]|nr:MAG: DDE domain-containing protein [Nitrosopumilus sp. H8]
MSQETVRSTGNGLIYTCKAHATNETDCQHIQAEIESIKESGKGFKIMERSKFKICKSGNIVKAGMDKTKTHQTFKCKDCKKRFISNLGFENMRNDPMVITRALRMYFTGMPFRDIADCLEQEGVKVSQVTVMNWVSKYSKMTAAYLDGIIPNVGNWFRADEVWIKVAGEIAYLFASMDDDTRFWLVGEMANSKHKHNTDNLLDMTKKKAGKTPTVFISDKLPAYAKSCRKIFGRGAYHKSNAGIRSTRNGVRGNRLVVKFHPSNNKMERLNGEIRDREKVFRGLKKMDTAIIDDMRIYYNFTKKHSSLDGMTPAEASGITVEGQDKWMTIIQNVAINQVTV